MHAPWDVRQLAGIAVFLSGISLNGSSFYVASAENMHDDGNSLLQQCQAVITGQEGRGTAATLRDAWRCMDYLAGFDDGYVTGIMTNRTRRPDSNATVLYCREAITMDQMARVVVRYLQNNPHILHLQRGLLVFYAMEQAFPCRGDIMAQVFAEQPSSSAKTENSSIITHTQRSLPQVSHAQIRLRDLGLYQGVIDGLLGPKTREALRWFQNSKGLVPTGEVNEATLKMLQLW